MTTPAHGLTPLEERKNVSVTLWCHICGRSRTCTDYDEVWGPCACGRQRWATWPKGEKPQDGDFTDGPREMLLP